MDREYNINNPGEITKFNIDLETRLRNFKKEWAFEFLERLRARTPVQTGALQEGWGFKSRLTSIDIFNVEDYAGYVEYGTEKMEPRAMLRTTLLESEEIAAIAKERSSK